MENIMKSPQSYLDYYNKGYRFPPQYVLSSLTYNKDKDLTVISLPADENLYVVNMSTSHVTEYPTPSRYFKKVNLMVKLSTDPQKVFDHAVSNDHFDAVYYDSFRRIYLRYSFHPNPKKKDEYDDHPWIIPSVIILDKDFNRLGEVMLEENIPGGSILFRKDGIYFQKYEPNEEDRITFIKYDLYAQ